MPPGHWNPVQCSESHIIIIVIIIIIIIIIEKGKWAD